MYTNTIEDTYYIFGKKRISLEKLNINSLHTIQNTLSQLTSLLSSLDISCTSDKNKIKFFQRPSLGSLGKYNPSNRSIFVRPIHMYSYTVLLHEATHAFSHTRQNTMFGVDIASEKGSVINEGLTELFARKAYQTMPENTVKAAEEMHKKFYTQYINKDSIVRQLLSNLCHKKLTAYGYSLSLRPGYNFNVAENLYPIWTNFAKSVLDAYMYNGGEEKIFWQGFFLGDENILNFLGNEIKTDILSLSLDDKSRDNMKKMNIIHKKIQAL